MAVLDTLVAWLGRLFGAGRGGAVSPPGAGGEASATPTVASVADAPPEQPAAAGPRSINAAGLALVKASEGLRLTAYQDGGGVWTIGYGHTGVYPGSWVRQHGLYAVHPSDEITAAMADELLLFDLTGAEYAVVAAQQGLPPLASGQFDALCDFCFNLGAGALHQLLAHGLDAVPDQLLRWDHGKVGGQEVELAALKLRRERERQLWETGSWA